MNAFPLCGDWGGGCLRQNKQAIAQCLLGRAMPIPVPRKASSGSGKRDERFRVVGKGALLPHAGTTARETWKLPA
jgi:hypothetical protein